MKVDTFCLSTSTAYIRDWDKNNFTHSIIRKSNANIVHNYSLVTSSFGIEKLYIKETYYTFNLLLNSKILGENYYKGFCTETIDQTIIELSKAGLNLDSDFLYNSKLKRLDITNDIKVTEKVSIYINSLSHLVAPNFYKILYKTGIVFKEKIIDKKLYVTFYSKEYHNIKSKGFFKLYPEQLLYFKNKLRMESKLSSSGTINKYLQNYSLPEILDQTTINPSIFYKIIGKQLKFPMMVNLEEYSKIECRKNT